LRADRDKCVQYRCTPTSASCTTGVIAERF
jgi:hypothetical protein